MYTDDCEPCLAIYSSESQIAGGSRVMNAVEHVNLACIIMYLTSDNFYY